MEGEGWPKVLFITRGDGRMNEPLDTPVLYSHLHVAEQYIEQDLPEWRKMPYCRNGGINLKYWQFVSLVPVFIHPSRVCGACLNRLAANGVDLLFGLYADTDQRN